MKASRLSLLAGNVVLLILLLVAQTGATPALSLGPQSRAQYQLTATFRTVQICSASPSNYTFIACGSGTFQLKPPLIVNVTDDGVCSSSLDKACGFKPQNITIDAGNTIEWQNIGSLNHTIVSNSPGFFGFSLVNNSLANKTFFQNSFAYRSFNIPGTYSYSDSRYPWIIGNVIVNQPPPPVPQVDSYNATGPLGWTVVGLDKEKALLNFNYHIRSFHNSTIYPETSGSSNQSGTFEDTINLSTRHESPGLASQFQYLPGFILPLQDFRSTGFGYSINPYYYQPPDVYTIWWVNGPLANGSVVELLTANAAVRGSDSFTLGASSYSTWVANSQFTQASNQTEPTGPTIVPFGPPFPLPYNGPFPGPIQNGPPFNSYPEYYTRGSSYSVSITLHYGNQSDLLFAASDLIQSYNQQVTVYPPGSYIYPRYGYNYYYGTQVFHTVNVTNTATTSVSLSLKLTSTNLDLANRMTPPPTTQAGGSSSGGSIPPSAGGPTSALNAPATYPWVYMATALVSAVVLVGIWAGFRWRQRSSVASGLGSQGTT